MQKKKQDSNIVCISEGFSEFSISTGWETTGEETESGVSLIGGKFSDSLEFL